MTSNNNPKEKTQAQPINEKIPFDKLQLITEDGRNIGIVSKLDALRAAYAASLDLVLISESGRDGVPIAKIMDFGKIMYEKKKQVATAKKQHKEIQVKEIKIRPKIGDHDFFTKLNQGLGFLRDGMRLKITLVFRGREAAMREEKGVELLEKIHQFFEVAGVGKNLVQEKDLKTPQQWTRIYYLKSK